MQEVVSSKLHNTSEFFFCHPTMVSAQAVHEPGRPEKMDRAEPEYVITLIRLNIII